MLVSVTRLHLRSIRFFPLFLLYAARSQKQAIAAPGFRSGWIGSEGVLGFWTVTLWTGPEAMRAFRNGRPHLEAMKKLLDWCDEASYVHWEQSDSSMPEPGTAHARMSSEGTVSKVRRPSVLQTAGRTAGERVPRRGRTLGA